MNFPVVWYSQIFSISVKKFFTFCRTLDSANFKPVMSISPVDIRESSQLGLVAVTEIGARLYFTTGAAGARPSTLQLMHVRLPPGFAANAPATRPNTVHMALYASGMFDQIFFLNNVLL